jgi:hypothetical protein
MLQSDSVRMKLHVMFVDLAIFPDQRSKLRYWVWTDWDLAGSAAPVARECSEPAMPPCQHNLKRHGICVLPLRLITGDHEHVLIAVALALNEVPPF